MKAFVIIVLTISLVVTLLLWISGIKYMKENHKDYKGKDFLDEEEEEEI